MQIEAQRGPIQFLLSNKGKLTDVWGHSYEQLLS